MFLKQRDFCAIPITNGFSFSPVALHANIIVTLSLDAFLPLVLLPFTDSVLSGNALKNKPVSSRFSIMSGEKPGTRTGILLL